MKAIETVLDVLDVLVPLEAKRQSVGRGTLFELVFEDPEDRSKNVTVFWYTEMYGTGKKDTVDYSDDEMAVVLSEDSEGVCLVDIEGEIISLQVYNCSVMVTAVEELQYLVENAQQTYKDEIRIGFEEADKLFEVAKAIPVSRSIKAIPDIKAFLFIPDLYSI